MKHTMQRVIVVGTPGAGKSTLAEQLALRLGYPFLELDALFWGPNWISVGREVFRERVRQAIAVDCWVAGGNYSAARDLLWAAADTLIWLDYPLWFSMVRLLRRTVRRIMQREVLWAGNRETWRNSFLTGDSVVYFALKTHGRRRREFAQLLTQSEHAHLRVLRFRSQRQMDDWVRHLDLPCT
jgi:adenylate kinase family enzyme